MTTAFSTMPFFRPSLVNDLFDAMLSGQEGVNAPAYNIEKRSEDSYSIVLAVPGFADKDLSITVQRDRLVVTGQVSEPEGAQEVEYLHRGIGVHAFERTFRLGNYMKVRGAEFKDGLLRIQLEREIPEEAKPRTIAISSDTGSSGTKVIEASAAPGQN